MNKLTEEELELLSTDFEIRKGIINKIEEIINKYDFTHEEYYTLIYDIISEYETLKFNKSVESNITGSYKSLKDITIKVLLFKQKEVTRESTTYENEVNKLILKLTNNNSQEI